MLHQWNRKRPIVVAHHDERAGARLRIDGHPHLLVSFRHEIGGALPILRVFAREHGIAEPAAEQLLERSDVERARGRDEHIGRLLRFRKCSPLRLCARDENGREAETHGCGE